MEVTRYLKAAVLIGATVSGVGNLAGTPPCVLELWESRFAKLWMPFLDIDVHKNRMLAGALNPT